MELFEVSKTDIVFRSLRDKLTTKQTNKLILYPEEQWIFEDWIV